MNKLPIVFLAPLFQKSGQMTQTSFFSHLHMRDNRTSNTAVPLSTEGADTYKRGVRQGD